MILGVSLLKDKLLKDPGYCCDPGDVTSQRFKLFKDTGNVCVVVILGVLLLKDKLFKDTGICCDPGSVTSQR